jgi:hypothetical protein
MFEGQVAAFASLIKDECRKKMGAGVAQQKTDEEPAESFGAGRCLAAYQTDRHSDSSCSHIY